MEKIVSLLAKELEEAFVQAGYEKEYAKVTLSNRPDLCEYQCNGAMAGAKAYKKAPIMIAQAVVANLKDSACIESAEAVNPGFINIRLDKKFVADYLNAMLEEEACGIEKLENPKTIIVDYGGANVAKPLHVGHLRSAIIGESIKRIGRYMGNKVIGDVHLGDWGYQMGLVSAYAKDHEEYKKEALQATYLLQNGHRGYRAVWKHIMNISVADLKKNYGNLNVEFDLWKGEADAQEYIPDMVERLKAEGYAHYDDGALVVDVKEESDTKEVPPCMILKSDGAALYDTTDLATLVEREKFYAPDEVIYLTDKRQELHFVQVFRCAKKTGIVREEVALRFLGFGTMNGKDGKPFKTRDGGVMRLEYLLKDIEEQMYQKLSDNRTVAEEEIAKTAKQIALAAVKYGDLSNQASKDYVFDVERFTSFEGNTGPYILYTIVRIKSILAKYEEMGNTLEGLEVNPANTESEKALMLEAAKFNSVIEFAYEELAPHKICAYIYDLANAFNRFYHEVKILGEEDTDVKKGYIALLKVTKKVLELCIDMLGFEAPERM